MDKFQEFHPVEFSIGSKMPIVEPVKIVKV